MSEKYKLTKEDVLEAVDGVLKKGRGTVLVTIEDYVILEIEDTGKRRRKKDKPTTK